MNEVIKKRMAEDEKKYNTFLINKNKHHADIDRKKREIETHEKSITMIEVEMAHLQGRFAAYQEMMKEDKNNGADGQHDNSGLGEKGKKASGNK